MAETATTENAIEFELVAPERLVRSQAVEMVVVPCSEGDIGILPGHAPLIGTVRPGVVDIHEKGKVSERIFVSGGFVEVTPQRCTLLAEEAMPLAELKREDADKRLADARAALDKAEGESEKTVATAAIAAAEAMQEALGATAQH